MHVGYVQTQRAHLKIEPHPCIIQTTPMYYSNHTHVLFKPHPCIIQTTPCIIQTTPMYYSNHTHVLFKSPCSIHCNFFTALKSWVQMMAVYAVTKKLQSFALGPKLFIVNEIYHLILSTKVVIWILYNAYCVIITQYLHLSTCHLMT